MSNNRQPQFVQQGNQQVSIDIQGLNPDQDEGLKRWYRDLKNLGSLGLKLIMPIASTVLAASGVAVISLSPKFRAMTETHQFLSVLCLSVYIAVTTVVAFQFSVRGRVNPGPRRNFGRIEKAISLVLLTIIWSTKFALQDGFLAIGIMLFSIQAQILVLLCGYKIRFPNFLQTLLCLAALVLNSLPFHNKAAAFVCLLATAVVMTLF